MKTLPLDGMTSRSGYTRQIASLERPHHSGRMTRSSPCINDGLASPVESSEMPMLVELTATARSADCAALQRARLTMTLGEFGGSGPAPAEKKPLILQHDIP